MYDAKKKQILNEEDMKNIGDSDLTEFLILVFCIIFSGFFPKIVNIFFRTVLG